jgi:hypothetical protein
MGVLLDLLTSEAFRKRPAMYAGSDKFPQFGWWLSGFAYGCERALPDQPYELDGFREWLHMRLDGPGNYDWIGIIAWKCENGVETIQELFKYLDQYLNDVSHLGIDRIIQDHAEYELRRYGSLTSSRLAKDGRIYR